MYNSDSDMGRHVSPVRPTFLRHMKQRFFLGLGASVVLVSALTAVFTEEEEEAVGWVTTEETERTEIN